MGNASYSGRLTEKTLYDILNKIYLTVVCIDSTEVERVILMLKKAIKRMVHGNRCDSQTYIAHLKQAGMRIGERVAIFSPRTTCIDETRPWLISIGDDVQIARGVTILTHGYDWSVMKGLYGDVLGSSGAVSIGNNVFIGMNAIILKGVHIGNNVIIGAGSVVCKDIPDNVVAAGNPARVITTLEEYYKKRKSLQEQEAEELVRLYRERYGKEPDERALHEFFFLFENGERELHPAFAHMMQLVGTEELAYQKLRSNTPAYHSMQEFLNHVP